MAFFFHCITAGPYYCIIEVYSLYILGGALNGYTMVC